ncbi:N amino acid transport system protein [Cytospora mali]|uniref:N amino acid transport system protein n=1 Tax=Cytospora mali TaxID=578113 RepID=A0A194W1J6_CYTMA|nr:N amino acid transport system protein [Valsa mali]
MGSPEKTNDITPIPRSSGSFDAGKAEVVDDDAFEVFKRGEGTVDFRTVGWIHASVIFLKTIFATGVLTIPSAMYVLGAFPGAINVLGWQALNTYCAIIQGNFRNTHAGCHSIADMAYVVGGSWLKEVVGIFFLVTYAIVGASGIVGASTALNALSNHAICTNYFTLVCMFAVFIMSSARTFEKIAWLTWAGFISVYVAVIIVVVGVTTQDRPVAAPQTGDFDLGYHAIAHPTFVAAITSVATIFCSGAGTSAFLPVISEMKKPRDYNKAVYLCMSIVTASYLAFSLVVYRWCGKWVASPSLGSAGPTLKKVSYGIGLLGLLKREKFMEAFNMKESWMKEYEGNMSSHFDQDELVLLSQRLMAYSFRECKFLAANIDCVTSVPTPKNTFKDLKITLWGNENHKKMVN